MVILDPHFLTSEIWNVYGWMCTKTYTWNLLCASMFIHFPLWSVFVTAFVP